MSAMARKTPVRTDRAPAPFRGAPYSQAIRFGDLVFVSGQIALHPDTNEVVEAGIAEQTEQTLANVRAILEEAGSSLENVVKATIFLVDLTDFGAMNEVYARHMGPVFPARATVQIGALPSGALIEIDVVAHL